VFTLQSGEPKPVGGDVLDLASSLDDLMASAVRAPAKQCSVGYVLEQLPEDQATKLAALIDETTVPGSRIAKVLQDNGYDIQYSSINRHRNRKKGRVGCTCP
jgi:hypothetical protein